MCACGEVGAGWGGREKGRGRKEFVRGGGVLLRIWEGVGAWKLDSNGNVIVVLAHLNSVHHPRSATDLGDSDA